MFGRGRRLDQVYENPRAAKPRAVNRTWRHKKYWSEVRRNLILTAIGVVVVIGLALAVRPTPAPSPAPNHLGTALNKR